MILSPLFFAAVAAVIPSNRLRPLLMPITAAVHLTLTIFALLRPDMTVSAEWLLLDPPGKIIILVISVLFAFCSIYAVGYLRYNGKHSNRVFCACFIAFAGIMSLAVWSYHLGLMWVAIEATTLVSAPLIYFEHTPRSIEATWKYMVVCSVGIALGLLGTYFLAYASMHAGIAATLAFEEILRQAPQLSKPWLHAAFVLLLVGYGTKMGLSPMHTWLPDAHSEAPSPVSAMLSGALLSCAFLAILRIYHICIAAGEEVYVSRILLLMGLFSMAIAGVFMIGQTDFKRMLAYSSVEHMGILAIGIGIGGPALLGTLLHTITHGTTKALLFLSAGNIYHAYGSKNIDTVCGAMRRLPLSGTLFFAGFLAITGSPPFGPFISEFAILNGAFTSGRFITAALFLFLLLVVFIGMGRTVLQVVQGRVPDRVQNTSYTESYLTALPIIVLMVIVLLPGVYIPAPLNNLLNDAVRFLEGRP